MSKREPRPAQLPALADPKEAEINQYALDWLRAVRSGEGDPFSDAAPHEVIQRMLKDIANSGERNAAFVVKMAVAEIEDAHEALADLISERNARGEPLGMALGTYVNMLSVSGPPRARLPEGRRRDNFVADYVIVRLLVDLMARFDLKLRRGPTSKRPSAYSIVADALRDAQVWAWAVRNESGKLGAPRTASDPDLPPAPAARGRAVYIRVKVPAALASAEPNIETRCAEMNVFPSVETQRLWAAEQGSLCARVRDGGLALGCLLGRGWVSHTGPGLGLKGTGGTRLTSKKRRQRKKMFLLSRTPGCGSNREDWLRELR